MRSLVTGLVALAALVITLADSHAGEPLQLAPIKGVVLLRNGQVFEGTIARTGDYYYITTPKREIRLKTGEVEKVASTREELYEHKRSHVDPAKQKELLDLAEWCVQQKLIEQAARELVEATSLEPLHPRIALIQRQIDLGRQGETEVVAVPRTADNGPSTEELDRFVRGLPSHAVETFTSTIQPLLVNNCTNSGCHVSSSSGKLRLLRLPLTGSVNRRLTQRNLYAVWQVIDADRPMASPLLTQPVRPHGKAKAKIFPGREAAQYRQLVLWVNEITRQRKPHEIEEDDPPEPVAANVPPPHKKKTRSNVEKPPKTDETGSADGPDSEVEQSSSDSDASIAATTTADDDRDDYVPIDPFDPEIFNRRYFPRK
jgi:hypothetical protein